MTCREAVQNAIEILTKAGVDDPAYDARELLCEAAGMSWQDYSLYGSERLPEETGKVFETFVARRAAREPLQRILGFAWFMGEKYALNEAALIPRYDSEILVLKAAGEIRAVLAERADGIPLKMLDIGTGTGCLIISLLKMFPEIRGTGLDLSERALEAARSNAEQLGVTAEFVTGDLFSHAAGAYDIIISNPPYIPHNNMSLLMPEVRCFDPELALDGGEDGLDVYHRLIAGAPEHLTARGRLIVETGAGQAAAVSELMRREGFEVTEVTKDLSGIDRVVTAVKAFA